MKTITVFTATRAEYHLLSSVIRKIHESADYQLDLIVSGTHLSRKYGYTVDEIERDGFPISKKISVIGEKTEIDQDKVISEVLLESSEHFKDIKSDLLIVLGDRYEIMGIVLAASNALVPIAHIHGGESTEGAIDEAIRHAVTKFSNLHFACCEPYRQRIIQMGENPSNVYNSGALGVENILSHKLMSKSELEENLSFEMDKFCLVTFHPVTLENNTSINQVEALYDAIMKFGDYKYIVTGANADKGGEEINRFWIEAQREHPEQICLVPSLGLIRYLSAMSCCEMVLGNSSSGILEAPSFEKPTVNIGDRQKGRIRAKSIIDCSPTMEDIVNAMKKAKSEDFKKSLIGMEQLYGNGNASTIIFNTIDEALKKGVELKKTFYNIEF